MKKYVTALMTIALVSLFIMQTRNARAEGDEGGAQNQPQAVKEVGAEDAHVLIEEKKGSPDFIIIDVRTAGEYSGGHIEDSVNIDYRSESFKDEIGKLDRSKTYLVHCRSGKRSDAAVKIMEEMGFTDIYEMNGGILGWQDAGFPVTK